MVHQAFYLLAAWEPFDLTRDTRLRTLPHSSVAFPRKPSAASPSSPFSRGASHRPLRPPRPSPRPAGGLSLRETTLPRRDAPRACHLRRTLRRQPSYSSDAHSRQPTPSVTLSLNAVADPLLSVGGEYDATLKGAVLAATRPADLGQLPQALHLLPASGPVFTMPRKRPGLHHATPYRPFG